MMVALGARVQAAACARSAVPDRRLACVGQPFQRPEQASRSAVLVIAASVRSQGRSQSSSSSSKSSAGSSSKAAGGPSSARLRDWLLQEHRRHRQEQRQEQVKSAAGEKSAAECAAILLQEFGGDEKAALEQLPVVFYWCRTQSTTPLSADAEAQRRGRGGKCEPPLPVLRIAQVLSRMSKIRPGSVVNFANSAKCNWLLIDSYLSADAKQNSGGKHASFADMLCKDVAAEDALAVDRGHVAAWLGEMAKLLGPAQLGSLLAFNPRVVLSNLDNALAVTDWAVNELRLTDGAQRSSKLACLQDAGLTAEQALQLVLTQALGMGMTTAECIDCVQAWVQQYKERLKEPSAVAPGWLPEREQHEERERREERVRQEQRVRQTLLNSIVPFGSVSSSAKQRELEQ